MPNTFTHWSEFTLRNGLHLLGIVAVALILNRLLRVVTNLVVKRAASQTRTAQMREQQTRTLAGLLFSAGTKIVWAIALLTAGTLRWLCLLGGVSSVLQQRLPGLLLTRADFDYVSGRIR